MKTNELRIGNYVNADLYNDDLILVESICSKNKEIFNSTAGEIPLTSIKPIILSKDWLIKFGFEKITIPTSIDDFYIIYYKKENFIVYLMNDFFEIELINKNGDQFNLFKTFKKEVHQLQNLYFALTNEEL